MGKRGKPTLHKRSEDFAAGLEKRVADNDFEELLEAGAATLDNVIGEAVGEDLAGERGDGHARTLALEDVAEVLEVAVAPAHRRLPKLESGDVGPAHDLVVRVHITRRAVRARVADLFFSEKYLS